MTKQKGCAIFTSRVGSSMASLFGEAKALAGEAKAAEAKAMSAVGDAKAAAAGIPGYKSVFAGDTVSADGAAAGSFVTYTGDELKEKLTTGLQRMVRGCRRALR